jgi:UDP-2,4-diacetamido-2,4,6-trideoxy-beta-L-altropyranose hydrolase
VNQSVLFRVDASSRIGGGHAMRCLSLAIELVARGARVRFLMKECLHGFERVLEDHGIELSRLTPLEDDAQQVIEAGERANAGLVVVDGYAFVASYRARLKSAGLSLLVIDDSGNIGPYSGEQVLNQNVTKRGGLYPDDASLGLLLGPRYALLRPQFRQHVNRKAARFRQARRLLVMAGASDPRNVTVPILNALNELSLGRIVISVVIGPGFQSPSKVRAVVSGLRHDVEIHNSPADVAQLMAGADLCVVAAGSTLWEVAALGLPAVALVVADNQVLGTRTFTDEGCGLSLDARRAAPTMDIRKAVSRLVRDNALRARMSRAGRRLVDGAGAARVADSIGIAAKK